jgi:hypothetical protein
VIDHEVDEHVVVRGQRALLGNRSLMDANAVDLAGNSPRLRR